LRKLTVSVPPCCGNNIERFQVARMPTLPMVIGFVLANALTLPTNAQTQILPDQRVEDSRLVEIQRKLQNVHGRGRPLTTTVRSEVSNKTDENTRIELILSNLLLDVGAEPVLRTYSSGNQFRLLITSNVSVEYGGITQNLQLNLYDTMSRVGERLIMSGSATLNCRERPYNTFVAPKPTCILDEKVIRELFLRLR
jgi:hypothetical protein